MRQASATPVTQHSSCNAAKAASGPLLAWRTKKKRQEFFKELHLLKAEFHSLGLPLKRLLQPFPVLRMCGKDLSKRTTFPLLKTHPSKHTHQNPSSFAGDDFPSCSVSLSLRKALWYLLKSIPGDSKMRFTAVLCWSKGPALPALLGCSSSQSTRGRWEGQRFPAGGLASAAPLGFVPKSHKHSKQKEEVEAALAGAGPSRMEEQHPALESLEIQAGRCVTLQSVQLGSTGAVGPVRFSITPQIPGCHTNPLLNPTCD